MKNIKCILLISACSFLPNESLAEINLTFDISNIALSNTTLHTHHTPVELKPISNFTKLAAVCSVTSEGCTNIGFGSGNNDINLDNASQCRDEGFGISCPTGYIPDASQKCPYNNSFFKCRVCSHSCPSGSLAYCSDEQIETGSSKNDCNENCYTCRAKSCEEGGYSSSINSCQKATSVSYAGKTCYTSVSGKNCGDGGYSASIPANQTCSSTSYCGNTCYHSCSQPACSVGGFRDAIPTNQTCTSTTYYGRTCYKDCYTPNCGAGGYNASIPSNNLCSSVNYYGATCYNNCYQPQCSAGGFEASIPSGKNCAAVSYYGRSCYKNCVNAEQVVTCSIGSILYEDRLCYKYGTKKPIAIVFDANNRLAMALTAQSTPSDPYKNLLIWGRGDSFSKGDTIPGLDICLNNTGQGGLGESYPANETIASCGTDGKANTAKILNYGKNNSQSFPAAEYCYNYSTAGTSIGDWHLPSFGEIKNIYRVREQIREALLEIGKPLYLIDDSYWSSTVGDSIGAWIGNVKGGSGTQMVRVSNINTLPVLKY